LYYLNKTVLKTFPMSYKVENVIYITNINLFFIICLRRQKIFENF